MRNNYHRRVCVVVCMPKVREALDATLITTTVTVYEEERWNIVYR